MKTVQKPWLAFKVMAAGAIPPSNAFRFAFQNGADGILAGMFDYEIAEDVKLASEALDRAKDRARPWGFGGPDAHAKNRVGASES
jgi:hypothetical protein